MAGRLLSGRIIIRSFPVLRSLFPGGVCFSRNVAPGRAILAEQIARVLRFSAAWAYPLPCFRPAFGTELIPGGHTLSALKAKPCLAAMCAVQISKQVACVAVRAGPGSLVGCLLLGRGACHGGISNGIPGFLPVVPFTSAEYDDAADRGDCQDYRKGYAGRWPVLFCRL